MDFQSLYLYAVQVVVTGQTVGLLQVVPFYVHGPLGRSTAQTFSLTGRSFSASGANAKLTLHLPCEFHVQIQFKFKLKNIHLYSKIDELV